MVVELLAKARWNNAAQTKRPRTQSPQRPSKRDHCDRDEAIAPGTAKVPKSKPPAPNSRVAEKKGTGKTPRGGTGTASSAADARVGRSSLLGSEAEDSSSYTGGRHGTTDSECD